MLYSYLDLPQSETSTKCLFRPITPQQLPTPPPESFYSKTSPGHPRPQQNPNVQALAQPVTKNRTSHARPLPWNPEQLRIQDILGGRYELLSTLGKGAFGTTYDAVDRAQSGCSRSCAIKVQKRPARGSSKHDYLLAEIKLLKAATGHLNVVEFKGFEQDRYQSYIIMELCRGRSLYEVTLSGEYANDDYWAKYLFTQILDGVQYIHSKNIFHRDLKPENILVTNDGIIKIIDFGLASEQETSKQVIGTKQFMAPEIFTLGGAQKDWRHATADIWALGMILIEMLTGWFPWHVARLDNPHYHQYLINRSSRPTYFQELFPRCMSREASLLLVSILNPWFKFRPTIGAIRQAVIASSSLYYKTQLLYRRPDLRPPPQLQATPAIENCSSELVQGLPQLHQPVPRAPTCQPFATVPRDQEPHEMASREQTKARVAPVARHAEPVHISSAKSKAIGGDNAHRGDVSSTLVIRSDSSPEAGDLTNTKGKRRVVTKMKKVIFRVKRLFRR